MAAVDRWLLLMFVAPALAGCASVLQPHLGPAPEKSHQYDAAPNLANAVAIGISMRDRYLDKVEGQIAWERGIGVGLIGGTAVAADLAMRGVGKSEILGLGLAGAALYTSSSWLFSKPQQMIYAAGASAVQCALDVVQPQQLAQGSMKDLRSSIEVIERKTGELEMLLGSITPTTTGEKAARAAINRAHAVLPAARELLAALDGAAVALRSSLNAIQLQVTNAYLANSPNLQGLVESLGKSLPALGSQIIGVKLPPMPDVIFTAADPRQDELATKAMALDALVVEIARSVALVNVKPSEERLKLCNVDLRQAGLAMRRLPPGPLTVHPAGAATTVVSGGALPYRAEWIGSRPPDGVTLRIESGQGLITVEAKASVRPDKFQMLVLDAGQGRETVDVVIGEGIGVSAAGNAASPALVAKVAVAANPRLRLVQQALIDKGHSSVKVDNRIEKLTADGRMGKVTVEAMRRFYIEDIGATAAQIPQDPDQLFREVAQLLGIPK